MLEEFSSDCSLSKDTGDNAWDLAEEGGLRRDSLRMREEDNGG